MEKFKSIFVLYFGKNEFVYDKSYFIKKDEETTYKSIISYQFNYILGINLYFLCVLTKTLEGNQEDLIDEDPTKYRRLVEAYVDETMRPLEPLSIRDGEITYVKQVFK